ncbi:hypothetical protein ACLB6G_04470 [Zhengella sp. ZM62]|uniref:hypothetical protein n=1 Tax=Zhengella sedimenti TaxID=3390035 RepID=UPI003974FA12
MTMRMFLAICLAFVFVLAHPGVPGGPALARQAEAAVAATIAKVHAHDEGDVVLRGDGHPCCPGMAGGTVSQGKASHCSLDGGFIAAQPTGLPARCASIHVPPVAHGFQSADPGAILHPPMPA